MPSQTTAAKKAKANEATTTIRVSYDESKKRVITKPAAPIKLTTGETLTFVSDEGYDLHIGLDPAEAFSRPSFNSGEDPVEVQTVGKNTRGMFWCGWTEKGETKASKRGGDGPKNGESASKPASHGWPHNKLYGAGTDIGR